MPAENGVDAVNANRPLRTLQRGNLSPGASSA